MVLSTTRENCSHVGMVGCGLQLDDQGDISWSEVTVTLRLSEEVNTFLMIKGIPFNHIPEHQGFSRISILEMAEFLKEFSNIEEYIRLYYKNRVTRLGSRVQARPWELNSRESFVIRMADDDFNRHFVGDPRSLQFAEIARGLSLHRPVLLSEPEGFPLPGRGNWK